MKTNAMRSPLSEGPLRNYTGQGERLAKNLNIPIEKALTGYLLTQH